MEPSKAVPAIIGALIGGIIGGGVWGGITYVTNYEIGWVAWGVGILVGAGAGMMGGRGSTMGMICAIIAALAILGGKIFAVQLMIPGMIEKESGEYITREMFQETRNDAAAFANVKTDDEMRQFMVARGFSEAGSARQIGDEELNEFKEHSAPYLRDIQSSSPSYEEWRSDLVKVASRDMRSQISFVEILKDSLGAMDILFFLLGVGTAFKVGSGKNE